MIPHSTMAHAGRAIRGRDVVGASYRRSDMPWIAPRHGAFHPMLPQSRELFQAADEDQLATLEVLRSGSPYWTTATIRGVQSRYPGWRSNPWRRAAGMPLLADDGMPPAMQWPTVKDVSGVYLDALRAEVERRKVG